MVDLCNSRVVDSGLVTLKRNERGHKQDQIIAKRQVWNACEPRVRDSVVAEVKDLNLFNCQNADYLNAHGSPAKQATVCLYGIGIVFVLVSFGDNFVDKSEVTTLMRVGNDGPAFKDAVKILKHSDIILDEHAKFRLTKTWLEKVDL